VKVYGNLMNRILEEAPSPDRHPYTIVEVVSPTKIVVVADGVHFDPNDATPHPDRKRIFVPDPNGSNPAHAGRRVVTKRKTGEWIAVGGSLRNGTRYGLGERSYYYDPGF
jgi:hypothetical protein